MADERKAKRRLSNLDFSQKKCHVALVDHGAIEHDETLVLKRKNVTKKKEDTMSLDAEKAEEILKAKAEADAKVVALEKAKADAEAKVEEIEKAKADLEAEKVELEKAKAEQSKQLEEVEKARVAKAKAELVEKAKDLKADDAAKLGEVLYKCKDALDAEEYETLEKQLEKLANIEENKEVLKSVGEADGEADKFDKSAEILKRRGELIEKGLKPHEASKKARLEVEAELASK